MHQYVGEVNEATKSMFGVMVCGCMKWKSSYVACTTSMHASRSVSRGGEGGYLIEPTL